jgi:hypothetical protein
MSKKQKRELKSCKEIYITVNGMYGNPYLTFLGLKW